MSWLYYGALYLASIRPVVMTAARRSRLEADSASLDLAMDVIRELRAGAPSDAPITEEGA